MEPQGLGFKAGGDGLPPGALEACQEWERSGVFRMAAICAVSLWAAPLMDDDRQERGVERVDVVDANPTDLEGIVEHKVP